ncbi:MAG: NAD-dependent epimerase/dehydratase family protein [Myxococcales bacterium]|nr:NAD-dependent epimerase/dehydratase family protein [Myxococcales bacterium]
MKVFITGATGFIGRHLCRVLGERGHRLRVLVRPTTSSTRLARLGEVEMVTGDLTVADSLPAAVDGCDAVVHLAGVIAAARRAIYDRVNADGTAPRRGVPRAVDRAARVRQQPRGARPVAAGGAASRSGQRAPGQRLRAQQARRGARARRGGVGAAGGRAAPGDRLRPARPRDGGLGADVAAARPADRAGFAALVRARR